MSTQVKTPALVLKKINLPNSDQILTVFSLELGKLRLYAKGIKKITSKRLSHVQTGNLVNISCRRHHQFYYLQETGLISSFSRIKKDQNKIDALYLLLFILDRILPEEQKEQEVYQLALRFLIELAKSDVFNKKRLNEALNRLKKSLGYGDKILSLTDVLAAFGQIIGEKIPTGSI